MCEDGERVRKEIFLQCRGTADFATVAHCPESDALSHRRICVVGCVILGKVRHRRSLAAVGLERLVIVVWLVWLAYCWERPACYWKCRRAWDHELFRWWGSWMGLVTDWCSVCAVWACSIYITAWKWLGNLFYHKRDLWFSSIVFVETDDVSRQSNGAKAPIYN